MKPLTTLLTCLSLLLIPWMSNAQEQTNLAAYSNYDFIPGEKILFEDDFVSASNGEFPPRWKLVNRQGVINTIGTDRAFVFMDCSIGDMGKVEPRINTKNYLSNNFTVEFDFFLPEDETIALSLKHNADAWSFISIQASDATVKTNYFPFENDLVGKLNSIENFNGKWYHAAFAYKDRQMKCYIDQNRVLVIPNCEFTPLSLQMMGSLNAKFKNFKLADGGGMNMLNKILTDGKFVTRAIKFDVNKAIVKGESMGFLIELANWLKQNATVKLEIGGHTDSDGDNDSNQKLSEKRAQAVKKVLTDLGIIADRLAAKGYGEVAPVSPNNTPEGKSENRRVELKKI